MENRFDEAAKIMAESIPRRESLRRLAGLMVGGVLALVPAATSANPDNRQPRRNRRRLAAAANGPAGRDPCKAFCKCKGKANQQCLAACHAANGDTSRVCGDCGSYTACTTPCCGNVCCDEGLECCSGTCTSLDSDSNCGACGNDCQSRTTERGLGVLRRYRNRERRRVASF